IPAPGSADSRRVSFEEEKKDKKLEDETIVQAEEKLPPESKEPLVIDDVDPAANDFDIKINYNLDRIDDVSVPGQVNPDEPIGILGGDKNASPFNIPAPPGVGGGQGGYVEGPA